MAANGDADKRYRSSSQHTIFDCGVKGAGGILAGWVRFVQTTSPFEAE